MIITTLTAQQTLNTCANSHSGTNFLVIAIALGVVLLRTDTGHRTLLKAGVLFAFSQAIARYATAWDIAHQSHALWVAVLRESTSVIDSCCVIYLVIAITDLTVTLCRSEKLDRLKSNKEDDEEQARLQLSSASALMKNGAEELLRRRQDKRREHDHAYEHVDRDHLSSRIVAGRPVHDCGQSIQAQRI